MSHKTLAQISSIWIKLITFFFDVLLIILGHASLGGGEQTTGKPGALSSPKGDRVQLVILGSKTIFLGLSFWVSKGGEKLSNRLFLRCSGSSPGCTRLFPYFCSPSPSLP